MVPMLSLAEVALVAGLGSDKTRDMWPLQLCIALVTAYPFLCAVQGVALGAMIAAFARRRDARRKAVDSTAVQSEGTLTKWFLIGGTISTVVAIAAFALAAPPDH